MSPVRGRDFVTRSSRAEPAGRDQEMAVRASHLEASWLDVRAVHRGDDREVGDASQDAGERADAMGGKVVHHEQRSWKVGRQVGDQLEQRVDAPCGEPHYYYIMALHAAPARTANAAHLGRSTQHSSREGQAQRIRVTVRGGRLSPWLSFR